MFSNLVLRHQSTPTILKPAILEESDIPLDERIGATFNRPLQTAARERHEDMLRSVSGWWMPSPLMSEHGRLRAKS